MPPTYSLDSTGFKDYYDVLGIVVDASFGDLKKAYYRRAKECHPDKFPGDATKEAEFKLLVQAFDTLSDPQKRAAYDAHLKALETTRLRPDQPDATHFTYEGSASSSIMDLPSDDYLEEVIVGNNLPLHSTLQTLLRDLENTEKFMLYREAKTAFFNGQNRQAFQLFQQCVTRSPDNILYHFYYAASCQRLKLYSLAEKHMERCLKLGRRRSPQQHLHGIRDKLYVLRDGHRGVLGKVRNLFATAPARINYDAEQDMVGEMNRAMQRLVSDQHKKHQKQLGQQKRAADQQRRLLEGGGSGSAGGAGGGKADAE